MRNKKGFTLIELLAVIVILAIIAIIATPIVLNIINNSRKSATERSAENYLAAVEQAVAKQSVNDTKTNYDGEYSIEDKGKTLKKDTISIKVSYNGTGLESGNLVIEKGQVTQIKDGKIDKWSVTLENGKVVTYTVKGESTLVKGSEFSSAILNTFNLNDNVLSISFYSNGNLPKGYTKNSLANLPNVSVSDDDKVKAYYDSKTKSIYVYSENQIYANPDSSYMLANIMVDKLDLYLSELNTSKVTNMSYMFAGTNLTSLDLSSFDTSNVADMTFMFENAQLLETITVSNKWVISSSTNTSEMFHNCGTDHVTVK